uniref:DUF726 domain-containing protein n=1 Tax=Panagrellus redivivus TaxID=6233 RepID=A0A7E4USN5_PANRE
MSLPVSAVASTSSLEKMENMANSRSSSSNDFIPSRFTSFPMRSAASPVSEHALAMASRRQSAQLPTSAELKNHLDPATRFAVADLLVTVLKLDFYRTGDEKANKFCKSALDLIIRYCALPEKTNASLRAHMAGEHPTEDIASLISVIKSDPYIKERGCIVLLSSMLVMAIEGGDYDSRYRVMLRHISALLGVLWDDFEVVEDTLTDMLISEQYVESDDSKLRRERSQKMKKIKRYMMIGAAGGVGGVLIGLTGGLAAPLVAAGAGVVIGTGAAAGIATTAGAAVLGSAFGVAGAGLAGYKMNKRVGAIEEFQVETLSDENSLHVVLCVSGWIDDENNETAFHQQWRHLWMSKEQYTLRYESKYLLELGKAIDYLMSFAVSYAIQHTLMETALAGLMTAIAWPVALLSCSSVLDNPWNVCVSRAAEVGEHLAEVLLTRQHGKRPITLIGFSLGARVIYHCLLSMSKRPDAVGIIEDVVLLGAPVSASPSQWKQICTVVGGRVINGYCTSDWLLKFLYRTMSVQFTIAGTGPVESKFERKIVNFNLSHIVKGHMDYSKKLTEVLEAVGVKVTPHSQESSENLKKYEEAQEATETMAPVDAGTKTAESFSPPSKSDEA